MKQLVVPLIVSAALAVSACHKKPETETTTTETKTVVAAPAPAPTTPATPAPADAPAPVGDYDTSKAVVSTVKFGAFPYLSLPDGYVATSPETLDLARFPFWVGDHFVWIEGKVYQSRIDTGSNKTFSKYELQRNIESLIAQAGGKKIVEAQLPSEMREKLNPDARQVDKGLGDIISNPVVVFLIHQPGKDIWVHFNASTNAGSWAIVEAKPFVATAKLLPPEAPKP